MNRKHTISAALFALLSFGCEARTLIGEVPDGAIADGGDARTTLPPGADGGGTCSPAFAGEQPFTLPPEVVGTWTGFVQGSTAGLASDAIKLVLEQPADGPGQIHVVYGTAAPPPPATSATEYYPPGWTSTQIGSLSLFEGVAYAGHDVSLQPFGAQWRVKFSIASYQGWDSWCRLQTSYPTGRPGEYNCVPGPGAVFTYDQQPEPRCFAQDGSGAQYEVSCVQALMCDFRYCSCDACGCGESNHLTDSFDLLFDADQASGANVHLMRGPN